MENNVYKKKKTTKKRKERIPKEEKALHRKPSKTSRICSSELDNGKPRIKAEEILQDTPIWSNLQLISSLEDDSIDIHTKLELAFAYVQSRTGEETDDSGPGSQMVSNSRLTIFLSDWVQRLLIASEKNISAGGTEVQLDISATCFDCRCWVIFKYCLEGCQKLQASSLSFHRDLLRVIHCVAMDELHRLNGEVLHVRKSLISIEDLRKLRMVFIDCVSLIFTSHGSFSNENLALWVAVISTVLELVQKIHRAELLCDATYSILLQLSCYLLDPFAKFLRIHPAKRNDFYKFTDELLEPLLHSLDVLHNSIRSRNDKLTRNLSKMIEEVVSQGIFHPTHIDGFLSLRCTLKYKTSRDARSEKAVVLVESYHKHLFNKLRKIISNKDQLALGGLGEMFRLFVSCIRKKKGVILSDKDSRFMGRGSTADNGSEVSEDVLQPSGLTAETRMSVFAFFTQIMEFFVSEIDSYLEAELKGGPILKDIHSLLRSINCLLTSFIHAKVYTKIEDISEGASLGFLKVIYDKVISFSIKIYQSWPFYFGSDKKELVDVLLLIAKEIIVTVHCLLDVEHEVVEGNLESFWGVLLSYIAYSKLLIDSPAQSLLTSEILHLACWVIDLYCELRQVSTSIFALCKALRHLVSTQQVSKVCLLPHYYGSIANSLNMFLCSMEFKHSACNAIKFIPEGQVGGCIQHLTADILETLDWVKVKSLTGAEIECVESCLSNFGSQCFNLQIELTGRGLSELYTLVLDSLVVTPGNCNLVGNSIKDYMAVLCPLFSILVSPQSESVYHFLSEVTGRNVNYLAENGNMHWIIVFFFRLYLCARSSFRQVISIMPPDAASKMSRVMGDMLIAHSGLDWLDKTSLTNEGYFCWIVQPSAPLPDVLHAVSELYLQDNVRGHSSLIYVLSAMALQRIVELNRLLKSFEYLIQHNNNLVHSKLGDDASLSQSYGKNKKWECCLTDLRREAAGLTKIMMKYLWSLPDHQLTMQDHAWDSSIGSLSEKSLPSALWWIMCQNVDIWCVHASKKNLKRFLALLIRTSVPLQSSINDFQDEATKPNNLKNVTQHEITMGLLSDINLYDHRFVRRHMASRFQKILEESVASVFSGVGQRDLNLKPSWEEVMRVLDNPLSVAFGDGHKKKDCLPLDATSHLLCLQSAESCQKEQLHPPICSKFVICQSLLGLLSWMPKGYLGLKSFKLYTTCVLNLERIIVSSLLRSNNELYYELVLLFVSCRRTLGNLLKASCYITLEGGQSSLSSVLMESSAPVIWFLKSLSAVVEHKLALPEDRFTLVRETILPVMDQTSSLFFSLSKSQFECSVYSSDWDTGGEELSNASGQEETDGFECDLLTGSFNYTDAWRNMVLLAETLKEHMLKSLTSVVKAFGNKRLSLLTEIRDLKKLSSVISCCQGFLWGLASALDQINTENNKLGKILPGCKVDFISKIICCMSTCSDSVNYFIRMLLFEDEHLPQSLSSAVAFDICSCSGAVMGRRELSCEVYADNDALVENAKSKCESPDHPFQSFDRGVTSHDLGEYSSIGSEGFVALQNRIESEQKRLRMSLLQGLFRGDSVEAAVFLRQLLIASSAILKLNLQFHQASSSWSLISVVIGISEFLISEFSKISMPLPVSFLLMGGVVKVLEQLGGYFLSAESSLSQDLYAKLIDLHLKALGKCIALQGKRATLASQESESSTKLLNGQRVYSAHRDSDKTYGLNELKADLRASFVGFVKEAPTLYLLCAVETIERALVGVHHGCPVNYEIRTGSSDGGRVSMNVAAGIDCLDLILEYVTGRKRLSLVKRQMQSFVASVFNVLLHLQGPEIFQNVESYQVNGNPDTGSVVRMCVSMLARVFGKHALFQTETCHVAQSLRVPAALFQNLFHIESREAPDSFLASDIRDAEDQIRLKGSVVDSQFSVELYAACCQLLCTYLKHHKRETQQCFALLQDSVKVLLCCLEMVKAAPLSRRYKFAWEVQEGIKCASCLRRVFEEMRQQKDAFGSKCFLLVSNYIWVYCGFGPLKIGIRREIDEALRPGIFALIDACSNDDLQHLHTAFGEGPCRNTLASLQHDYKINFQYEGKV